MSEAMAYFVLLARIEDSQIKEVDAALATVSQLTRTLTPWDTKVVVTTLSQRIRVLRELRTLQLSKPVLVIRLQSCLSLYSSGLLSWSALRANAWMVFRPAPTVAEAVHGSTGSYAYVSVESALRAKVSTSSPSSSKLHKDDTAKSHFTRSATVPLLLHEATEESSAINLSVPEAIYAKYACQRNSPLSTPNDELIELFSSMQLARTLQIDSVGVRAYSTVIASLKAFPYKIEHEASIKQLEGCGSKIVSMVAEYLMKGHIREITETWTTELKVLLGFWHVHGVGAVTARDWYHKGYRDINDAIQNSWFTLTRPVQIGLKFYDDFLQKMSRAEVAEIALLVEQAANRVAARTGAQTPVDLTICGGYRRGKPKSGDVDVVLTHETCHGYDDMLLALLLELKTSTLIETVITSLRETAAGTASSREDRLSTAFVVVRLDSPWPQYFRRLDIIVAHPLAYTSAVMGWTGGTTFERDLRIFTSKTRGWRFDSTGLTEEHSGLPLSCRTSEWSPGAQMDQLERNLFAFIGLDFISPENRNTG